MRIRALLAGGIAALGASLVASTAQAATTAQVAPIAPLDACADNAISQPFAPYKDLNYYALAPGGTFDSGAGWAFSGGANVVATDRGSVLDMPSKAQATSPVMCITSDYPKARMWVRDLVGSEGVFFYVSYYVNGAWTTPKNTGQVHGNKTAWTLPGAVNVQPYSTPGWQQVRFTLVAGGTTSHFQVDDFWVDPRARF
jgi:hypothetical protein